MWKLVTSNIRQRPTRAGVTTLAISLGIVLLIVTVGLSYGQLTDQASRTRRVGGDFILQPSGASLFLGLNSGTLPVKVQQVLESIQGVEAATPVLVKFVSDGFYSVFGVDKESFQRVSGGLSFVEGRMFEKPFEVIADTIHASANKLEVGQVVELLGHEFTIAGIFNEGTAARILVPLDTLQELNGTPEKATIFFVRARPGEPLKGVQERLNEKFKNYKITPTEELQELLVASAPAFRQFISAIIFVSVSMSFMMTLLAMYSTIVERTREIGILKSLGASKGYIVRLIVTESLVIACVGVSLGFLLSALVIRLIVSSFPHVPVVVTTGWCLVAALIALVGASLGSLYPAVKAARLDPVRALGYE